MSDLDAPDSPLDDNSIDEGPESPDQSSTLSDGETTEHDMHMSMYNTPMAITPQKQKCMFTQYLI